MEKIKYLFLMVILLVFLSCSSHGNLSPQEAFDFMKSNDYVLLDLSKAFRYRDGHIKGAISVEFHPKTFKEEINRIDREKTVIIYCGTGKKTEKAKVVMKEMGFKKLIVIEGGLRAWKEVGLNVYR